MAEDETIIDQPSKKRKLHNSSNTEMECEVASTATQSQDVQDISTVSTETYPRTSITEPNQCPEPPLEANGCTKEPIESTSVSQDKYRNLVNPEELDRLRQFDVLDEVKSNDEDSNDENSDDSDGKSVELPDEEIDMMLEADLPDAIKGAPKTRERPFITRQKIVLEEKGVNHFEILPLDWIMVRHISGMPIYMHRFTRVCTLSKPYFLGQNNTRRHDIPISAIPCFAYRKALEEEEEKQKEIEKKIEEQYRNVTCAMNDEKSQKTGFNITNSKTNSHNGSSTPGVARSSRLVFECPIMPSHTGQDSNQQTAVSTDKDQSIDPQRVQSPAEQKFKAAEHPKLASSDQQNSVSTHQQTPETSSQQTVLSENLTSDLLLKEAALIKEEIIQGIPRSTCPVSNGTATEENSNEKGEGSNAPPSPKRQVPLSRQAVILPGGIIMPPPRVETINTSWKAQHLTPEQINNYCKNLFKFKTVNIMHFKRWADRRKYTKARKTLQYPTLPEGTKLITIPAQPSLPGQENGGKSNKRDWVMNMNDRSYLSVFHEYVGRALQKQPIYHFRQLENAAAPYQAIVYIGGMQYGVGYGSSKRQAKSAAARASIHILIPEMKDELDAADPRAPDKQQPDFHDFFDLVGIEDPRITEFCSATCEPSPYAILRTCLLRNFGAGDRHIHTEMKKLEFQKIELTMKVGKHTASVICKNKKTAKQRASQSILQALHPHVRSWGSLLRLYGSKSMKSCKEKKLEEQQITLLQDKARHNEPNYAVLEKLRHEMRKLRERDEAVVPIGTLLVREDLPTHSGSNLNNVDL